MEYIGRKDPVGLKRKILVVEDNDINRAMLSELLSSDFDVIQAENGLVGLRELERNYESLSLVLLDVYMPECDGFEFLRRKSEDERYDAVPVIVATASDVAEDEITCLELGANDFILKPYNYEVIMNRVHNMVRLRESASLVNQLAWDRITGLYSKEYFYRTVQDEFATAPDGQFDMVCVEVYNFKTLNNRYGENSCNQLLRGLAKALVDSLPGFVAGGRIAGDTFAFLIDHQERGWEERLYTVTDGLNIVTVNVNFGIVQQVDYNMPVSGICDRAIIALETVRSYHGNGVALFDDELHQRQITEQILTESMETALKERQFVVNYQPKHDLHTDTVGGAEALVRWVHPDLGFISPDVFISLFERNGFIAKLDMYVWEEACREIKRCEQLGLPIVPISVNASSLDFDEPDLAQQIVDLVDRYEVDHSRLHIELTETAYSDNPQMVASTLETLRAQGFSTELDDFGSGYSSLVSLNSLSLDVMKLDRSVISQATTLNDYRILESALKLAQILGLKTVVEGVETEEEMQKVKELGCDLIQGYYYSRPLPAAEFEEYLAKQC